MTRRVARLLPATLVLVCAFGCEAYNAPPEVKLRLPAQGVYVSGDPLLLEFSEPIEPGSLSVRVWPAETDGENELLPGTAPRLDRCTLATSPCGTTALSLSEDGLMATLQLDAADLGQPDRPLILDVLPGLTDRDGFERSANTTFDVQFAPQTSVGGADFQDGVYYIVGTTNKPIPTTLRLVTQIVALEDGRIALVGAEANPIEGAPKNTTNIDEVTIDTSTDGFTIHAGGTLSTDAEDKRFLQTEPFTVQVLIAGLMLTLNDVIVQGTIIKDEGDNDFIDGTLNFSGGTLIIGGNPTPFDGDSAAIQGVYVPPEKVPPGGPVLCEDLCGQVQQCEPPPDFPPADFCVE